MIDKLPYIQPKKLSAKGRERADSLMAAAIDLFSKHNYSNVTIQDITKRAGATHSLVYYHFKNKEDLFNQAVTNLIRKTIIEYQESRKHHHNPVDLINGWFENNITNSKDLRKLVKIMFDYAGPHNGFPSVAVAIKKFYQEEHRILADSVAKGIISGHFTNVDPARIASFISTRLPFSG